MHRFLLSLFVLACFASAAFAQGSRTLSTNSGGAGVGNPVCAFEMKADRELTLHRLGVSHLMTGNIEIAVWMRPGPIGVTAPSPIPLDNWTRVGITSMQIDQIDVVYQIPIDLDIQLAQGQHVGLAIVRTVGCLRYYNSGTGPVSNTDLTIINNCWIGSSMALAFPSFQTYYGIARAYNLKAWYDAGPTVSTSVDTLVLPDSAYGLAGATTSYKVNGDLLAAGTNITAPAGTEISFNATSGFSSGLQIGTFPEYPEREVFVRLKSGIAAGHIAGNIVHTSTGAPNRDVAVSGNIVSMTANSSGINMGNVIHGAPGAVQGFLLSAAGLTSQTTITAPTGYEISKDISGPWTSLITLTTMSYQQNIYARMTGVNLGVFAGNITCVSGPASVAVPVSGEVVPPYNIYMFRHGPNAISWVDNDTGGNGLLLLSFTLKAYQTAWDVPGINFVSTGTANSNAALSSLVLYEDNLSTGNVGVFDLGDSLATTVPAVSFTSGAYAAALANSAVPPFAARRFFLVGKLAGTAVQGQTLGAEVASLNASSSGPGVVVGAPTTGTAPALAIGAATFAVVMNGPGAWTPVVADTQGPNGNGHVVADVTMTPRNGAWTVASMMFIETGTIHAEFGVNSLGLYLDDGNGTWDGPGTDGLATPAVVEGFLGANGTYIAVLDGNAPYFGVNQSKRFFLVAKLSGTATPGQSLRVTLAGMGSSSPTNGEVLGVPTATSTALVIELATLTVAAGPVNPAVIARTRDAAGFQQLLGSFRFSAFMGDFVLAGFTMTTGGNGNWANSLDAAGGVQVYLDNGDGKFDTADALLSSSGGTTPAIQVSFASTVSIAIGNHVDVWVVLNALAAAGKNPAETFSARIAAAADVAVVPAGAYRAISSPAPQTGTLRVVDFAVDSITPTTTLMGGAMPITITGKGFALPVSLSIGGVACPGTAVVNATGTEITGLTVPAGAGANLAIVLTTNELEPQTLAQTFTYSTVTTNDGGSSNGCTAGAPIAPLAALIPAVLGFVSLRRRRK